MSQTYATEKLSACVSTLATSEKALPDRLGEIAELWVRLEREEDFPDGDVRASYDAIDEALCARGEIRKTVLTMTADEASGIATKICDLYEAVSFRE